MHEICTKLHFLHEVAIFRDLYGIFGFVRG